MAQYNVQDSLQLPAVHLRRAGGWAGEAVASMQLVNQRSAVGMSPALSPHTPHAHMRSHHYLPAHLAQAVDDLLLRHLAARLKLLLHLQERLQKVRA